MHGDQFGPQRRCPPAGTGHRGRDVVKLEIKKHPQPLLAQLRHHLRAGLHEQLQAHLHPAQPLHLGGKDQGLIRGHAIEGDDDPIGGISGERWSQGTQVNLIPSCRGSSPRTEPVTRFRMKPCS